MHNTRDLEVHGASNPTSAPTTNQPCALVLKVQRGRSERALQA